MILSWNTTVTGWAKPDQTRQLEYASQSCPRIAQLLQFLRRREFALSAQATKVAYTGQPFRDNVHVTDRYSDSSWPGQKGGPGK
jgi:hypothetical protein